MGFASIFKSVALVSGVTGLLNLAVSFIFSFLMTKGEYGNYTYWLSIYLLFLNFLPFGGVAAVTVFRFSISSKRYNRILYSLLFFILPLSLIIAMSGLYIKSLVYSSNSQMELLAVVSAFFYSYCLILLAILRVEQEFKGYSVFFICCVGLLSFSQLGFYLFFRSFESAIYGHTLAMAIFGCSAKAILSKKFNFKLEIRHYVSAFRKIAYLAKYGMPIVLGSVLMSFMVVGDKIMIKTAISEHEMGVYSSIAVVCSTTLFLVNNFAAAWSGYLSKNLVNMNHIDSQIFFLKYQKKIFPISVVLSVLTIAGQTALYSLLYGFENIKYLFVVIFLSLGYCVYGISKFYVGFLMFYRFNDRILKATSASVLFLMMIFSLEFGEPVIRYAIGVFMAFLLQLLFLVYFVNNLMRSKEDYVL